MNRRAAFSFVKSTERADPRSALVIASCCVFTFDMVLVPHSQRSHRYSNSVALDSIPSGSILNARMIR